MEVATSKVFDLRKAPNDSIQSPYMIVELLLFVIVKYNCVRCRAVGTSFSLFDN